MVGINVNFVVGVFILIYYWSRVKNWWIILIVILGNFKWGVNFMFLIFIKVLMVLGFSVVKWWSIVGGVNWVYFF